MELSASNLAQT